MQHMEDIVQLKHENEKHEDQKEGSDLLNMNFRNAFTNESTFERQQGNVSEIGTWKSDVNREETQK